MQDTTATSRLFVTEGPHRGRTYGVPAGGELCFGRGTDMDVVLPDVLLSKAHFTVQDREGGLELRDLGSRNGTFRNGERVSGPVTLENGDEIAAGGTRLEFVCVVHPGTGTRACFGSENEPYRRVSLRSGRPEQLLQDHWKGLEGEGDYGRTVEMLRRLLLLLTAPSGEPELIRAVCFLLKEFFRPERVLYLTPGQGDQAVARAWCGRRELRAGTAAGALDIVKSCLRKGHALRSHDLLPGEQGHRIRAAACVPVAVGGIVRGALYMDRIVAPETADETVDIPPAFSEADFRLFALLGNRLGMALERRSLEAERREADRRFRWMVETTPQLIFTLDADLRVTYMNGPARRAFGLPGDGPLPGEPLPAWEGAESGRLGRALRRCLEGDGSCDGEFVLPRKGAERVVQLHMTGAGREAAEPDQILCMGSDVTEERRMREMMARMERLSTLGKTLSGIAHEINNPLMAVQGYAELLVRRTDLPADVSSSLEVMRQQAARAGTVLRRLLLFGSPGADGPTLVSAQDLLERLRALKGADVRREGLRLETSADEGVPQVRANGERLLEVLVNLVSNAQEALEGRDGQGTVAVRARAGEDGLVLTVEDDGPGVPEELRERIFDPFFTTKPLGRGTGLGLSVSHAIVAGLGGTLRLLKAQGGGALFRMSLPAAAPEEDPRPPARAEEHAPAGRRDPSAALTALVVEDEPSNRDMYRDMLTYLGIPAQCVSGGREAVTRILLDPPFLVLCDVRMPGMSGMDIYREVAEVDPRAAEAFLFVTGDVLTPEVRDFLGQSGAPHLEKPFGLDTLRSVLGGFCRLRGVEPPGAGS